MVAALSPAAGRRRRLLSSLVWQQYIHSKEECLMSAEETLVQRAYTSILEHFVQTGRAPHYTELGQILGLSPDEALHLQREAAKAGVGCWFVQDTDYIESWAPFYNAPTQYRVTVAGEQKWYGQ
jgi:hypothetical protein